MTGGRPPGRPGTPDQDWARRRALAAGGLAALLVLGLAWGPATAASPAPAFEGRVVGVADGDTLAVLRSGRRAVVRLHGVDAPERGQAFGRRARAMAGALAFGLTVTVRVVSHDRFGRVVGEVFLPDGRSLNEALVRAGGAWWFRRYTDDPRLAAAEAQARAARAGLWAAPHPIPPWEWRRGRGRPPGSGSQVSRISPPGSGLQLSRFPGGVGSGVAARGGSGLAKA